MDTLISAVLHETGDRSEGRCCAAADFVTTRYSSKASQLAFILHVQRSSSANIASTVGIGC